jgi:hypothetical protein
MAQFRIVNTIPGTIIRVDGHARSTTRQKCRSVCGKNVRVQKLVEISVSFSNYFVDNTDLYKINITEG